MTLSDSEQFLGLYDDIAVEIVSDQRPNTDVGLSFSNAELAENICAATGWETFDLLGRFDFDAIHHAKEPESILAHAFISFLRWRLFMTAADQSVGDPDFNVKAVAYSEYWYIALVRRWNELTGGPQMRPWLN